MADGSAWALWETIASNRPSFGHPWVFDAHIDESKWISFTATLRSPTLLRLVRDFTGNVPGRYIVCTSKYLMLCHPAEINGTVISQNIG